MSNDLLRHTGRIVNTGKRVAVIFMQIPDREDHALVVDTEALPPKVHQPLMKVLESIEGQQAQNLGELLGRRIMDTGDNMLSVLHAMGYLQPVNADLVVMTPRRGMEIPLKQVTSQLIKDAPLPDPDAVPVPKEYAEVAKFNPYANVTEENNTGNMEMTSKNLLLEADLLEQEAARKRQQAYQFSPQLAPTEKKSRTSKKKE